MRYAELNDFLGVAHELMFVCCASFVRIRHTRIVVNDRRYFHGVLIFSERV